MQGTTTNFKTIALGISVLIVVILSGVLAYGYKTTSQIREELSTVQTELDATKESLLTKEAEATALAKTLEEIKQAYAVSEENGTELLNMLTEEKGRNDEFSKKINSISGTVGKLDKLSKTDPELLQKYSKVYFLNEHYMPGDVVEIPEEYRAKVDDHEYIHEKVSPFLLKLFKAATRDGIDLRVVSAYRSFDEQKALKSAYSVQYGSGANAFSADQGYSEHQLGTTIDFSTPELNGSLDGFEKTEAYTWLKENAYRYGFVLSYPEKNSYYVFEPWHWRFVGHDLADDLYDDGKYFYDLDQREIDKYLISLFD